MKGLEQIRAENKEASNRVKEEGIKPHEITKRALKRLKQGMISELQEIPFVGDANFDKTYLKLDNYFVDSSGFGREGEPALTIDQFIKKIKVGNAYAITSVGQFQINIQEYFSKEKEV